MLEEKQGNVRKLFKRNLTEFKRTFMES